MTLTADQLKDYDKNAGFRRAEAGWIEVTPKAAIDHVRACRELVGKVGGLSDIRGKDIPETLIALGQAAKKGIGWTSPWTVYFSQSVKDSHRIIDTKAQVEFKLNIVDSDGCSLLQLDPIYNHERFQLSHSESEAAATSGEGWIRRKDAWIRVDDTKYRRIATAIDELELQPTGAGFVFPASRRERSSRSFRHLERFDIRQPMQSFLSSLLISRRSKKRRCQIRLKIGTRFESTKNTDSIG